MLAATTLLRNVSVRLNFTRGGSTLYSAGSFVGYVGILSAVRPEVLSLSLNTRMMSHPIIQLFDVYVSALEQRGSVFFWPILSFPR